MYHDAKKSFVTGGTAIFNPPNTNTKSKYLLGWPPLVFPYMEETNRRDVINGFSPNALYYIEPWRITLVPSNGQHPVFTDDISVFICPSSELLPKSPDAVDPVDAMDPLINAMNQAPLHYRGNAGSSSVGFVQGNFSNGKGSYTTSGVIYPESTVGIKDITDGASHTILLGETSSAVGRNLHPSIWGGIQPWTWGYYWYGSATAGWLMIDNKMIKYPIGYTGAFLVNDAPFASNHGGGAKIAFCDGSVQYYSADTALDVLQALATRASDESIAIQ